jgi:hypothetical protein
MEYSYPDPEDIGIRIPPHVQKDRFCAGFRHGLSGGQLDRIEYLKQSFREGFRASRLYLSELRRARGILEFPARWRIRLRAGDCRKICSVR